MPRSRGIRRWLRNIVLAVVLLGVIAIGLILGIDNQTPMTVRFLNYQGPQWPSFWWLLAAFGSGTLLGLALCAASLLRNRVSQRRLRRSLRRSELELDQLRGDFRHGGSANTDTP